MLIADQNRLERIRAAYVTIVLVAACTGMFLLPAAGIEPPFWLAFIPDLVAEHGDDPRAWVGLVTHAVLHGGLLHLLGNMLALWAFGDNVEDAFGHLRFAAFFALCAAAGAAAFGLTAPPGQGLVGASGAIAGIMAAYLLLYPRARVVMLVAKGLPVSVPASWFVGLWLLANLVHAAGLPGPGPQEGNPTAWFAHLGGFAAGIALTTLARPAGVPLFQPGPAGDAGGWLARRAFDLGPPRDGAPWTLAAVLKAALFVILAGLGMLALS